jgi:hypothetical protein
MVFGCGPAILATSSFYKITLPFSIAMAISVYFLNDILIDIYGINGAAISTLIVLFSFTILKVFYINYKLNIQPYNRNTIKILLIVCALYLSINYIGFEYSALIDIVLRSLIVSIIYLGLIYYLGLSKNINQTIKSIFSKHL